jgi:transmembrane sensor
VAAAAILAVAGASALIFREQPGQSFATGPEETRTVALADGSIARLAPGSVLEVRGATQRDTYLTGRAFFAIASDSSSPFVVRTDAGEAEVLGTRFEMIAAGDSLRLVVVEGSVALLAAGSRVDVKKNEVSRVGDGSAPTEPQIRDVWQLLDWPDGLLVFHATPFTEVVREVEGRFGVPFVIEDSLIASRSVTAWFDNETFEEVTETICQVVGAVCTLGDVVEVSR